MIFYARWNDEISGTASVLKVDDGVYELGKMAVTANAQGQGIGKALMEHVIKTAKKLVLKN